MLTLSLVILLGFIPALALISRGAYDVGYAVGREFYCFSVEGCKGYGDMFAAMCWLIPVPSAIVLAIVGWLSSEHGLRVIMFMPVASCALWFALALIYVTYGAFFRD